MTKGSLLARSIAAIALLIGFYVLALGVAGALLWVVYAQVAYAHRIIPKLMLICVALAGIIVWSVLPRPDRFEPPGPRIREEDHPRLFALIRDVAARTGQATPRDVYLVADVNAFVAQRGGIMGFFSHRVMGLGLPLLALLSVSELRAVLAHEYGHFHGGDVALGPWIYKTRGAIGRTIVSLAEHGSSIVRKPFEWYGEMFLRVTQAISRQQELAADELAARVVGARHLASGLRAVHGGGAAFGAFLQSEYVPVLEAGYRPPMAEGFRTFLDNRRVKASVQRLVDQEIEAHDSDPYDTHPPLAQRLRALESHADDAVESDDTPAITLLGDAEAAEASLVTRDDGRPLGRIAWQKVATQVFLPQWQDSANKVIAELGPITLAEVVRPAAGLGKLAARILDKDLSEMPEAASRVGGSFAGAAVCCTLARHGWAIKTKPGRPIVMRLGDKKLSPFKDFEAIVAGDLGAHDLVARLGEAGVDQLRLQATDERPK